MRIQLTQFEAVAADVNAFIKGEGGEIRGFVALLQRIATTDLLSSHDMKADRTLDRLLPLLQSAGIKPEDSMGVCLGKLWEFHNGMQRDLQNSVTSVLQSVLQDMGICHNKVELRDTAKFPVQGALLFEATSEDSITTLNLTLDELDELGLGKSRWILYKQVETPGIVSRTYMTDVTSDYGHPDREKIVNAVEKMMGGQCAP